MRPMPTALAVCILLSASGDPAGAAPVPAPADKVKELRKEYLATVTKIYELTFARYKTGQASPDQLLEEQTAILSAKLELAETRQEWIKAYEEMVAPAEQAQEYVLWLVTVGQATTVDALKAKAALPRARIALEKAKAENW